MWGREGEMPSVLRYGYITSIVATDRTLVSFYGDTWRV